MTSELPGILSQLQPILTIVNKKKKYLTKSCYNPSADWKQIAIHFCGFPYTGHFQVTLPKIREKGNLCNFLTKKNRKESC